MKHLLIATTLLFTISTQSQTLHKNVNSRAEHIQQSLSVQKDSLILNSTKNILYVKFIEAAQLTTVKSNSISISLQKLLEGRNTVMLYEESGNIVVFSITMPTKIEPKTIEPPKLREYDITSKDRENMQTREQYRATHLRPNGKPYD